MDMHILICDDNSDAVVQEEFVIEEAMDAIKKHGNIRTFTSAKACLAAVQENKKHYGIVFLDIEMPYISGIEYLLPALKSIHYRHMMYIHFIMS